MGKISVVINTLNEEKNLPHAIASIGKFADEIVVVDMNSDDQTAKVAKKLGAKVYTHERTGYVEPARNFAISKATGKWILILDADEEVSQSLISKLKEIVEFDEADYVRLPRKNIVFAKALRHSRWWPDYNIRFFRKGKVSWDEIIHSVPMTEGKGIDLEAKDEFAIVHHHYETIEQFIERMNRYTTIQAKLKLQDHVFQWNDLISKPSSEFLSRFFLGEGYRDGIHGLALSLLQSFSELVVYLKVWQITKFNEENLNINNVISQLEKTKKEFTYWENDTLVKESGGLIPRIRRKLKV